MVVAILDVQGGRQVHFHAIDLVHLVAFVLNVERAKHTVKGTVRQVLDEVRVIQQAGCLAGDIDGRHGDALNDAYDALLLVVVADGGLMRAERVQDHAEAWLA
eukprot:1048780-Alexandrium_andersonii.AAC.1